MYIFRNKFNKLIKTVLLIFIVTLIFNTSSLIPQVYGASAFTDGTSIYGISDGTTGHFSSSWIDIDNDGDLDLYTVNASANNKLYINNGIGNAFTDGTSTYGIADGTTFHCSSSWIDIDNDGDLDLYITNSNANNKLYINNGPNQSFTDETTTYGIADGTNTHYTSTWIDIDNDNDLDLYVINYSQNNKLYINNGANLAFTDKTTTYGISDGTAAHVSASWIDIDNDGDLDLYSVKSAAYNKLFINNGPDQAFSDQTNIYNIQGETNANYSSSWIDIDNDGDLDLYIINFGTNNKLYINNGPNQAFTDATSTYGLADGTATHRSSSWIDIDNDGDLDIYLTNRFASNVFYINPGQGNNYLKVFAYNSSGRYQYNSRIEVDRDGNGDFSSSGNLFVQYQSGSSNNAVSQYFTSLDPVGTYFGLGSDSSCKYDVRVYLPGVYSTANINNPSYTYTDVCPNSTISTGIVSISINENVGVSNNSTQTFTGSTSTKIGTISSVSYQLDSTTGSWSTCTATDGSFGGASETFSCTISLLGNGSHQVFFKSTGSNLATSTITLSGSAQDGFTIDTDSPLSTWTNSNNASRDFVQITPVQYERLSTNIPSFSFTKSHDDISGISKYQILLYRKDMSGTNNYYWQVYIDDISPNGTSGQVLDEEKKYVSYFEDSIFTHPKDYPSLSDKSLIKLDTGAYKWKVRVFDKAGNSKDTVERILMINTNFANFSNTFFPLSIMTIGNTKVNLSSIVPITTLTKTINLTSGNFSSTSPLIVYGITLSDATITGVITKDTDKNFSKIYTTKSQASRYGLNITDPLAPGVYTLKLYATNLLGDYVGLDNIKLRVK